ncbi:MAG: SDR family oxidoreductase [Pseudomonadota bacterium]
MKRFDGLTCLLTGATGGFGVVTARRLAAEGARLVLSDLKAEPLEALAASLDADTATLAGDVGAPQFHHDLVALARETFGALDVAINNAGIANPVNRIEDIPEDEAEAVIRIDLMGVFWALQAQIPAMDQRKGGKGGAIVNLASAAGVSGAPTIGIYAAAKHGVVGLSKTAAAENARRGIRVNAVCPAYARTPMVEVGLLGDAGVSPEQAEQNLVRGVPMRRLGTPDEVAQAILFAAAPENGFMTGQSIIVDGGINAI